MKPESRRMRTTAMRLPMLLLLLGGLASLSGCIVTNKVLDLRKEHETRIKEATNFWSLSAVRSAQVMPGGEMYACVEFRDSPADAPQTYTIDLSQASRIGKTYADFMPAGYSRTGSPRKTEAQTDIVWYLYPLHEAQKGCGKAAGENPLQAGSLKIETIQIHREDQSRLPEILLSLEDGAANEDRVVEVSFASENHGVKGSPELKKESLAGPPETRDVLLVYLPAAGNGEQPRVLGIAGAFEPGSEWVNPYTLLVLPAVAADTAIITTIIMIFSFRGMT
jgi:hypothetical protein